MLVCIDLLLRTTRGRLFDNSDSVGHPITLWRWRRNSLLWGHIEAVGRFHRNLLLHHVWAIHVSCLRSTLHDSHCGAVIAVIVVGVSQGSIIILICD